MSTRKLMIKPWNVSGKQTRIRLRGMLLPVPKSTSSLLWQRTATLDLYGHQYTKESCRLHNNKEHGDLVGETLSLLVSITRIKQIKIVSGAGKKPVTTKQQKAVREETSGNPLPKQLSSDSLPVRQHVK